MTFIMTFDFKGHFIFQRSWVGAAGERQAVKPLDQSGGSDPGGNINRRPGNMARGGFAY